MVEIFTESYTNVSIVDIYSRMDANEEKKMLETIIKQSTIDSDYIDMFIEFIKENIPKLDQLQKDRLGEICEKI